MIILADENISGVGDCFAACGELRLLPGRAIDADALRGVDALLVRSVTRVDASLLRGSACRFVGSATSGIDHVDTACLQERGIAFAHAAGSNAASVVDYVFSALASLSQTRGFDWRDLCFGIVGCGHIGSALARRLLGLGIPCRIYDPFLAADHPLATHFSAYDTVLGQHVVSFHTPLTQVGPWPTRHMLGARELRRLVPGGVLVNSARGAVVDNAALLAALETHPDRQVVLDAWEGEPAVDLRLLRRVALGTAHIAGYSMEGKLRGTRMLAEAYCRHFDLPPPSGQDGGPGESAALPVEREASPLEQLNRLILDAYDAGRDHTRMQALLQAGDPAVAFDRLRRDYPERHEFSHFRVTKSELGAAVAAQAAALGFQVLD